MYTKLKRLFDNRHEPDAGWADSWTVVDKLLTKANPPQFASMPPKATPSKRNGTISFTLFKPF
jgi:hypothetical protein